MSAPCSDHRGAVPATAGNHLSVAPLDRLSAGFPTRASLLARGARALLSAGAERRDSDLTPAGAPLEVAFVWPADELRFSLDPCPGQGARVRVAACHEALTAPLSPAQAATACRIEGWQQAHGARYGAWLGLRAGAGALRSKLYLEVPDACAWSAWEAELACAPPVLPKRGLRPSMVGLDVQSGAIELYYRCGALYRGELDTLLRRFRMATRGAEVVAVLEALTRRAVRFELPSHDMGFSCSFDAEGCPRVFTWYSTCAALLGPPARARDALLRVGGDAGWPMEAYACLTDGGPSGEVPAHGMIGAVLAEGQPLQVTATVAAAARAVRPAPPIDRATGSFRGEGAGV